MVFECVLDIQQYIMIVMIVVILISSSQWFLVSNSDVSSVFECAWKAQHLRHTAQPHPICDGIFRSQVHISLNHPEGILKLMEFAIAVETVPLYKGIDCPSVRTSTSHCKHKFIGQLLFSCQRGQCLPAFSARHWIRQREKRLCFCLSGSVGVHSRFTYLRLSESIFWKIDRLVQLVRIHRYHKSAPHRPAVVL